MHGSTDNIHKQLCEVGIGGWKCSCCAPPPGKYRKAIKRSAKRRARRELDRLDTLNELNCPETTDDL